MRLEAGLHLAIATADQRDQALGAMHSLWGGDLSVAQYQERAADTLNSPWARDHYAFYVVLGPTGEVQASCQVYELPMWALGRPIRSVGFGAVFTAPEFRRKGLATNMLRALMELHSSRGFRLATLFSDIRPEFYERLGFRRLTSRRYIATIAHLPPPQEGATWRPAKPADGSLLVALHEGSARSLSLAYARTVDQWPFLLDRAEAQTALLEDDGTALGYAAYAVSGSNLVLYDWGATSPKGAFAIVRSAPLLAPDTQRMRGWLPEGAPAADLPFEVEEREQAIWMVAPLGDDPPPLAALASGPHHAWILDHF